jgi:hypothetical protein
MNNASEPAFLNPEITGPEITGPGIQGPEITGPGFPGQENSSPQIAGTEIAGAEIAGREITGAEIAGLGITGREIIGTEIAGAELSIQQRAGRQYPGPDPSGPGRANKPPVVRRNGEPGAGVLKAMSPGVVDFLFRRLVAGEPAEDVQWGKEGTALAVQPPGAELARRLAETDLDALTPTELFHYVRAAQRLAAWAEALRETAVGRYCSAPSASSGERRGA